MTPLSALVEAADQATASGDLQRAERLLLQATQSDCEDPSVFVKLAALQRASGRLDMALQSIHRALAISPRDFTALLVRASLLDRVKDPNASEAWSHALAQKPDGELPAHLQAVIARAEARVEQWTDNREDRMRSAMSQAEEGASADEQWRLNRFRTNVLRRTRPYHSEPTHYHFPELTEREFHPRDRFPWITLLESMADTVGTEFQQLMESSAAQLVPYIQYDEHLPLEQWRELNKNEVWSAFHLVKNGEIVAENARRCPRTMELLEHCDQPKIRAASPNAMFSLLAPHTVIPPHVGVNNTRLVCHLPLIIPEGCWFRVGAETRQWNAGEAFVFDDTIEHEASNPTDRLRVVFIFDTWNPGLSAAEREGIRALIEADGVPSAY